MGKLFSLDFWATAFMSTIITMICFYVIKKFAGATNIPLVNEIAESV